MARLLGLGRCRRAGAAVAAAPHHVPAGRPAATVRAFRGLAGSRLAAETPLAVAVAVHRVVGPFRRVRAHGRVAVVVRGPVDAPAPVSAPGLLDHRVQPHGADAGIGRVVFLVGTLAALVAVAAEVQGSSAVGRRVRLPKQFRVSLVVFFGVAGVFRDSHFGVVSGYYFVFVHQIPVVSGLVVVTNSADDLRRVRVDYGGWVVLKL